VKLFNVLWVCKTKADAQHNVITKTDIFRKTEGRGKNSLPKALPSDHKMEIHLGCSLNTSHSEMIGAPVSRGHPSLLICQW